MRLKRVARLVRDQIKNYYRHGYRFVPKFLCIETTTACNASCVYCPRHDVSLAGPHMDFDLFKSVIDAVPFVERVAPYSRGEPLMYPHIIEAVQYITDSGKGSVIYTNGSLLTEERVISLFEIGLNELSFSIDTDNPREFKEIRGLNGDLVFDNVTRAVRLRDEMSFDTQIRVRACVGSFNKDRIHEIARFWRKRVDEVRLMPYIGFPPVETLCDPFTVNTDSIECSQLYQTLNVRVDGTVAFCCNDWNSVLDITKIDNKTAPNAFLKIYNSKMMNSLRLSMETGRNAPSLCAYCRQGNRSIKLKKELIG